MVMLFGGLGLQLLYTRWKARSSTVSDWLWLLNGDDGGGEVMLQTGNVDSFARRQHVFAHPASPPARRGRRPPSTSLLHVELQLNAAELLLAPDVAV